MRIFHLTDFPMKQTYVLLKPMYQKTLLRESVRRIGSIRGLTRSLKGVSRNTVKSWLYFKSKYSKENFPSFIRLDLLLKLLKITSPKFSVTKLEKNVTHIRSRGGGRIGKVITNPKLPIKENAQLIRVVTHLICDGFASDINTPLYYNTDSELLDEFEKDLQVFGNVPTYRKGYKIAFPRIIAHILKRIYKIEFDSYNSNLPKILFFQKELAKEAVEVYIDDEGSIYDDKIVIHSVNKVLLSQLRNLIIRLGLPSKYIGSLEWDRKIYLFKIKSGALESFHKIFTLTCRRKENFLVDIIKRRERGWFLRPHGVTRSLVLNYLEKPSTIREVGRMAQIHFSGVAKYVHILENDGLIKKIDEIKGANIYQRVS